MFSTTEKSNSHTTAVQQKTAGNSFIRKAGETPYFGGSHIQAKLNISTPDDPQEKEADAMADKVVRRLSNPETIQTKSVAPTTSVTPLLQRKCAHCEEEEKLQKKEEVEEKDLQKDKLQKKPIAEANAETPKDEDIQRKCAECEKEEQLQKKGEAAAPQNNSPSIESALSSSKGGGQALPADTRTQMESSFGADLSGVRIHKDSSAIQMSKDLNAQAFTHGSDIYFNSGKYNIGNSNGQHLLAHELTHVVQQKQPEKIQAKWWGGPLLGPVKIGPILPDLSPPPYFGLKAAPDAFTGISLEYKVHELPSTDYVDLSKKINKSPYIIRPQLLKDADGEESIEYFVAFRNENGIMHPTNWIEYIIGPDSIEEFLLNIDKYKVIGAGAYMFGPPPPNVISGGRFVNNLMGGEFKAAGEEYLQSLYDSVRDPNWWAQMIVSGAGYASAYTPRIPPAGIAPIESELSIGATQNPILRLVSSGGRGGGTSVVGRTTGLSIEGNLARALDTPVLKLVETPITLPEPTPATALSPSTSGNILIPPNIANPMTLLIVKALSTSSESTFRRRKQKDAYPLCWPVQLPLPGLFGAFISIFHRAGRVERDTEDQDQRRLEVLYRDRVDPSFRAKEWHVHHVVPLFLGGLDAAPGNLKLVWHKTHLAGHQVLQYQPQMLFAKPPLPPLPRNILQHPVGTKYELVGYKWRADHIC